MKLSNKSQKTYEALVKKSNEEGRMPSLKRVAAMLQELEVSSSAWETQCTKQTKAEGMTYYTGGGTKLYEGVSLSVYSEYDSEGRRNLLMDMDSTDTYYSWNTHRYASQLVELVDRRLSGEVLNYVEGRNKYNW
jgi:hypothetical protein